MKTYNKIIFLLLFSIFSLHAEENKMHLSPQAKQNVRSLNMGAARLQPGIYGWTPLMQAARNGNISEVKNLIDTGVDVNVISETEDTALLTAIYEGHNEIVKLLLSNKAEPNLIGRNNETPLILAIKKRNIELINLLLNNGADANYRPGGYSQNTALDMAVIYGYLDVVELLIPHTNTNLSSALSNAIWKGNVSIVKLLLNSGADPNKGPHLFTAAEQDSYEMVELLIKHGAKTNKASGIRKRSPMFIAVSRGNIKIAEILLNANANVSILNDFGQSLMDIAKSRNNEAMINLLKKYKAPDVSNELERFINIGMLALKDFRKSKRKISYLETKFGKPINIIKLEDVSERSDPTIIYSREKWFYDGLQFILSTDKDYPTNISMGNIELSNSQYRLISGLKVGDNKQRFIDKLGSPVKLAKYSMTYRIRHETSHDIYEYIVKLHIDENGNIDEIYWK